MRKLNIGAILRLRWRPAGRRWFAALAALVVAVTLAVSSPARPVLDPCTYERPVCPTYAPRRGIAGGGEVRTESGRVHFSLFASRIPETDPELVPFEAEIEWIDPTWDGTGLTLESGVIGWYGPTDGVPNGREVWGHMSGTGRERLPFVLRMTDGGPPGSGLDTVSLQVGDALGAEDRSALTGTTDPTGFAYDASGALVGGDIELLGDGAIGTPTAGTEAATPGALR